MNEPRKKSPRAPTLALDDALDRVLRAYDRERLHAAPSDVIAQHIGYKGANNGAALSALASLRYFGLLERPKEGLLSVSKDVESYKFSPDENMRKSLVVRFLKTPPLFSELLEKYSNALPSEANLRYELIQRGFSPAAAEGVMSAFIRSVQYADYFKAESSVQSEDIATVSEPLKPENTEQQRSSQTVAASRPAEVQDEKGSDRIPIRLTGGRLAWLIVPVPLIAADKPRLKAQIDLLLTEDED